MIVSHHLIEYKAYIITKNRSTLLGCNESKRQFHTQSRKKTLKNLMGVAVGAAFVVVLIVYL
jgi:hypothetical protein